MRRALVRSAAAAALLAVSLAGCAQDGGRQTPGQTQGVAEVMQQQMQGEGADAAGQDGGSAAASSSSSYSPFDIDIDLTDMSSEMIYATVSDMVQNPDDYEGRVIRMQGPYYHSHFESNDKDYFYVIIEDATACCSQGIEFVWDDGSHVYPDDYPADETQVSVTGVFETYEENGYLYPHLVDAQLVVM